jgi:tetratricopeptide (TPR) repeat protein
MYLRTPKRYRPGRQRRQLKLFSSRSILRLLIVVFLVGTGWYVWNHQNQVRSSVMPHIENLAENVQTQVAPRPTTTATPDLAVAQSGCSGAYQQGNMEEAIKQCSILAENNPNDVGIHYRVSHMLIITSNFGQDAERIKEALAFAEKTINADPEAPDGWAIRAMALDWKGDVGEALASGLHAKALDETFAPAYTFLGEIYHDLGQDDLATEYLDKALTLDTSGLAVADTFRNQGLMLSDQQYWEESNRLYERALESAPSHAYIAVEMAFNYINLDEPESAISVLTAALEKNPTDPSVLWALGYTHVRSGNVERGREYYSRCLDTNPDNVPCLSHMGGLQYWQGSYGEAIVNLGRAIELGSADLDDYLQIGASLAALERCPEAINYLQQGYQLAVNQENVDQQTAFATTLQDVCNVLIDPELYRSTPTPAPIEEPTATPETE